LYELILSLTGKWTKVSGLMLKGIRQTDLHDTFCDEANKNRNFIGSTHFSSVKDGVIYSYDVEFNDRAANFV
jgi:hypothetical protein